MSQLALYIHLRGKFWLFDASPTVKELVTSIFNELLSLPNA